MEWHLHPICACVTQLSLHFFFFFLQTQLHIKVKLNEEWMDINSCCTMLTCIICILQSHRTEREVFKQFSWSYAFRCGPYESSMSVLDSSRFHWQRCRSSSHSVLDRRPRRNSCSTLHTQDRLFGCTPTCIFYICAGACCHHRHCVLVLSIPLKLKCIPLQNLSELLICVVSANRQQCLYLANVLPLRHVHLIESD